MPGPPPVKVILQMGVAAAVQSEFETQATHVCVVESQRGVAPLQSLSIWHCTHCIIVDSHLGAVVGQSMAVRQPTQAPVLGSQ
jgi:hypothetical protein